MVTHWHERVRLIDWLIDWLRQYKRTNQAVNCRHKCYPIPTESPSVERKKVAGGLYCIMPTRVAVMASPHFLTPGPRKMVFMDWFARLKATSPGIQISCSARRSLGDSSVSSNLTIDMIYDDVCCANKDNSSRFNNANEWKSWTLKNEWGFQMEKIMRRGAFVMRVKLKLEVETLAKSAQSWDCGAFASDLLIRRSKKFSKKFCKFNKVWKITKLKF